MSNIIPDFAAADQSVAGSKATSGSSIPVFQPVTGMAPPQKTAQKSAANKERNKRAGISMDDDDEVISNASGCGSVRDEDLHVIEESDDDTAPTPTTSKKKKKDGQKSLADYIPGVGRAMSNTSKPKKTGSTKEVVSISDVPSLDASHGAILEENATSQQLKQETASMFSQMSSNREKKRRSTLDGHFEPAKRRLTDTDHDATSVVSSPHSEQNATPLAKKRGQIDKVEEEEYGEDVFHVEEEEAREDADDVELDKEEGDGGMGDDEADTAQAADKHVAKQLKGGSDESRPCSNESAHGSQSSAEERERRRREKQAKREALRKQREANVPEFLQQEIKDQDTTRKERKREKEKREKVEKDIPMDQIRGYRTLAKTAPERTVGTDLTRQDSGNPEDDDFNDMMDNPQQILAKTESQPQKGSQMKKSKESVSPDAQVVTLSDEAADLSTLPTSQSQKKTTKETLPTKTPPTSQKRGQKEEADECLEVSDNDDNAQDMTVMREAFDGASFVLDVDWTSIGWTTATYAEKLLTKCDPNKVCADEAAPMLHPNLLEPSPGHCVMVQRMDIENARGDPPKPLPANLSSEKFSRGKHVTMPLSVENSGRVGMHLPRNEAVRKALERAWQDGVSDAKEFKALVSSYTRLDNVSALNQALEKVGRQEKKDRLEVMKEIARLALMSDQLFQAPLPLLFSLPAGDQVEERSVSLSQQQCASLLALAFYCCPFSCTGQQTFNDFGFDGIFWMAGMGAVKLDFFFNYFRQVTQKMPTGMVTFLRRSHSKRFPQWEADTKPLAPLGVLCEAGIEDAGGMLQADFANCYIGGGALGHGAVQEEIRFLICPEMIVSQLLCERMDHHEAIVISGAQRYSSYDGYGRTLEFFPLPSTYKQLPRDACGRQYCELVAIDAIHFERNNKNKQYEPDYINRELNKAYVGLLSRGPYLLSRTGAEYPTPFATGNWGCGVFNGDVQLKFLLQLVAASFAGREMLYFPFGEDREGGALHGMDELFAEMVEGGISTSMLMVLIKHYRSHRNRGEKLFSFVRREVRRLVKKQREEEEKDRQMEQADGEAEA